MIDHTICTSTMPREEAENYRWFVNKMEGVVLACTFMPKDLERLSRYIKHVIQIYIDSKVFQADIPEIRYDEGNHGIGLKVTFWDKDHNKIPDLYHYMKDTPPNKKAS